MSKFFDVQNSLKTGLVANITALTTTNVIVDQQKDIDNEVSKAMNTANGLACVIGAPEWENTNPDMPGPRLSVLLRLLFQFRPIISDVNNDAAHDIIEDVMQYMHLLTLTPRNHMCEEFKVLNGALIPDPEYLSYAIDVETIIQL